MITTCFKTLNEPWDVLNRISYSLNRTGLECGGDYPAANLWVRGDTALVTAEVPGVKGEDFDISVSGNTLSLSGKRPKEELHDGDSYHRRELRGGEFSKSIRLPFNIDTEKVHASYKKGVLRISLSRLESDKPRNIKINA